VLKQLKANYGHSWKKLNCINAEDVDRHKKGDKIKKEHSINSIIYFDFTTCQYLPL
jgi:hypothetical protein